MLMDRSWQGTELGEAGCQSQCDQGSEQAEPERPLGTADWRGGSRDSCVLTFRHKETRKLRQVSNLIRSWWEGTAMIGSRAPGGMSRAQLWGLIMFSNHPGLAKREEVELKC